MAKKARTRKIAKRKSAKKARAKAVKTTRALKSAAKPRRRRKTSNIPKGYVRQESISASEAAKYVARPPVGALLAMAASPARFICVPTGPPPSPCLRYGRDPQTGTYSIPPFGEEMDCAACRQSAR